MTKARYDLLPWEAIEKVAELMTTTGMKHGDDGWKTIPLVDHFSAMMRHAVAASRGNPPDHESGMSHWYHVAARALFIAALVAAAEDAEAALYVYPNPWFGETPRKDR